MIVAAPGFMAREKSLTYRPGALKVFALAPSTSASVRMYVSQGAAAFTSPCRNTDSWGHGQFGKNHLCHLLFLRFSFIGVGSGNQTRRLTRWTHPSIFSHGFNLAHMITSCRYIKNQGAARRARRLVMRINFLCTRRCIHHTARLAKPSHLNMTDLN